MSHHILIVDDEPTITNTLKDFLSRDSYGVFIAASAEKGLEVLAREEIDVVISDEVMPGMLGSEFLSIVRQKYPNTIRMIITGHASVDAAVRSINEGEIYRFFTKPFNVFDLAVTIRQALKQKDLMKETQRLHSTVKQQKETIEEMERQYPGITKVKKDPQGVVIIDDIDLTKWDALVEDISSAL